MRASEKERRKQLKAAAKAEEKAVRKAEKKAKKREEKDRDKKVPFVCMHVVAAAATRGRLAPHPRRHLTGPTGGMGGRNGRGKRTRRSIGEPYFDANLKHCEVYGSRIVLASSPSRVSVH